MKENFKQSNKIGIYNFKAHFIKLADEGNGCIKAEIGFTLPIQSIEDNYEDARTDALNRAQSILRELEDTMWYFRLMND